MYRDLAVLLDSLLLLQHSRKYHAIVVECWVAAMALIPYRPSSAHSHCRPLAVCFRFAARALAHRSIDHTHQSRQRGLLVIRIVIAADRLCNTDPIDIAGGMILGGASGLMTRLPRRTYLSHDCECRSLPSCRRPRIKL